MSGPLRCAQCGAYLQYRAGKVHVATDAAPGGAYVEFVVTDARHDHDGDVRIDLCRTCLRPVVAAAMKAIEPA